MKKSEVNDLLAAAKAVDRWVENGPVAVAGWHRIVGDEAGTYPWLTYPLALAALDAHYERETRTVMIADIINGARAIREQRLARAGELPDTVLAELAEAMPAGADTYRAVLAAAEDAIVAGRDPGPAAVAARHGRLRALDGRPV